ncbi:MarR family transcriptional regulator [Phormidium pseudopriestleyi FRX01]|uniref:MarR family transcriptional regulator n=1 Tax=Phormidium pseudopriestleyi FRX01 TaxID=1759528 RepID=A0ABS3FVB1_9CYAN|nr:MarR family transcriptional regulator [Phormidium pseudopriestleyi]MBO0351064.1 MarR family transcriptional regulator [Phormidium pseudopriestleyi FRX01]
MSRIDKEAQQFKLLRFVEEVGLLFELSGMPRMAGRILGWLLIADPPHQSLTQVAEALQASKGSISTMSRLLIQAGIVDRVSLPGDRRDYFCIKLDAWTELIQQKTAQIKAIRQIAERGLELLEGEPDQRRQRLEEMRDFHTFFERELPRLSQRWESERHSKLRRSQFKTL